MTARTRAWLMVCLLACGCSFGAPKSSAELSTEDACRALANRAFDEQHRELLSEGIDQSTTPFSAGGTLATPNRGLSTQYAHDVAVDDCIARRTSSAQGGQTYGPGGSQ